MARWLEFPPDETRLKRSRSKPCAHPRERCFGWSGFRRSGPDHRQNHFEPRPRLERVRLMGGHENHLAAGHAMRLAGNPNFHLAFDHLHQRIEWRRVFAQPLAFVEGKNCHRAGGFLDQFATHDGAVLVIDQFGGPGHLRAGEPFGFWFRVLFHDCSVCFGRSRMGGDDSPLICRSAAGNLRPMTHLVHARKVFDIELAALKAVRAQLDNSFARAVEMIVEAVKRRSKIIIVGIGKSGNVGQKISATLTSTGSTSVVLNSVDALYGDVGIVNDGDVILALSYSGESEELLNLLPALKRFSVKIISVTGGVKSSLARHSDIVLNVRVPREACPFNLAPTASTTAMLVMGDALAMAVLQARGFKQSDFAKYHPSGAIGRAMLLRVGDIMRTGDRNAIAREDLVVKEALLVMTRAKSGSLSIVNAHGKLVGVFTDGDFRRHMAVSENLLNQPLKKVMTCCRWASPSE